MANAIKQAKKAMVYLGLVDSDPELETAETAQIAAADPQKTEKPQLAAVAPLKRVTPTRAAASAPLNEILTVHPTSYADAPKIAENYREGIPVILNLARMSETDARRIIDFASGLVLGLSGHLERVTGKVFLLTPENIAVSDFADEDNANDSGSFFVRPAEQ